MRNKYGNTTFIGRVDEIRQLTECHRASASRLVILYGRRRIGKSFLIKHVFGNENTIFFEGIENGHTNAQIANCIKTLSVHTNDPFIAKLALADWADFFELLTKQLKQGGPHKPVLVFDELQWLACKRSLFVSYLKLYWDNHWKNMNVLVILCGSVANFMVRKVIKSKALYGRIDLEMCLRGLYPCEAKKMLRGRGNLEIIKFLLTFGNIPKYLADINVSSTFNRNINRLFFSRGSNYHDEFEKIFFSQFKESRTYKRIVELLAGGNHSASEISQKLKIISGGGLNSYIENLVTTDFVRPYSSIGRSGKKSVKYRLVDEFLVFYFKYIRPNLKLIAGNESDELFERLVETTWTPWLALSFESFCLKNALLLAKKAGFDKDVLDFGPFYMPDDKRFQIDLLYKRSNNVVVVCEVKFTAKPVGSTVITDIEKKISLLSGYFSPNTTFEKMLISTEGMDRLLKASGYFQHQLDLRDILRK